MKKNVLLSACVMMGLILPVSCNSGNKKQDSQNDEQKKQSKTETKSDDLTPKPYPWDFPEGIPLQLELGQYVLSIHTFYPRKLKESKNPANETYIFYNTKVDSIGQDKSKVGGVVMPNSLIIPIPKGQKAKKGDIILTWWQKGSGMKRAIVKDASNPAEPKVDYLDMKYDDQNKESIAIKHGNSQLKPSSFVKLENGKWQPGMPVVYMEKGKWKNATLIHATDDKVLLLAFAGKIITCDKNVCKLIPINEDFKKGDSVYAVFADYFREGYTVEKYDKALGRVWVKKDNKVEIFSILEVAKDL